MAIFDAPSSLFHKHFTDKARDFVFLLQYVRDHNFTHTDIVEAHDALVERGLRSVSADQIKAMMHATGQDESIDDESICPGRESSGRIFTDRGWLHKNTNGPVPHNGYRE